MKKIKNIYSLLFGFLLLLIVFAGCKKQGSTVQVPEETTQPEASGDKLDLLELPQDKTVIPLEFPKAGEITGKITLTDEVTDDDSLYTTVTNIPDEIDSLNSQAYRIQLFSSKVYGESRKAKKVADEIFDRPVFMDYEVPYYKIRVGNFSDREKAEEYALRAKSAGYSNAWVVAVIVSPNITSPMYDDLPIQEFPDSLYNNEENSEDDSNVSDQ
ncbi:MAG: SPOR domain-containing protein [Calditrichaeota bacterium]|nr:MAG: SPOR domain-containing protein [Calditrichota bacterium]